MNIILFQESEIGSSFRRDDRRVIHMLDVLRRKIGDSTDVGLINGPRGKAILTGVTNETVGLEFEWGEQPAPLFPIDLIVGLSRPQTSRKILLEATSLGVRRIFFVSTDRGEPSYATSKLWSSDEWERLVRAGVEQSFSTRFPDVQFGITLAECIEATKAADNFICMDNYEATIGIWDAAANVGESVVLAVGSERGWTENERNVFRSSGFSLAHLGDRPLRTETAATASISVISAQLQNR